MNWTSAKIILKNGETMLVDELYRTFRNRERFESIENPKPIRGEWIFEQLKEKECEHGFSFTPIVGDSHFHDYKKNGAKFCRDYGKEL